MYSPFDYNGRVRMQNFGPKVSGGMSEEATRRLQQEERAWQSQQTELAYERQKEMQAESEQRASANAQREERLEDAEANALEKLEGEISDNIEAVKTTEDDKDKDLVMDFYSSRGNGGGNGKRPE